MPTKKHFLPIKQTVTIDEARQEKPIADQAVLVAHFAAQVLSAAEQLGIKRKVLDNLSLAPAQKEVLSLLPGLAKALKKKLTQEGSTYSVGDVASMAMALAEDLPSGDARKQVAAIFLAKHLMDQLLSGVSAAIEPQTTRTRKSKSKAVSNTLFQFKITLVGSNPPIWRRIQVKDCTLDKLHEHIQTAMGWTNSHLHQFEIKGQRFGDPELLDDGFEEVECLDSTITMVSEILPKTGKRFVFKYEYDFGDSWVHEVRFEGNPAIDPKAKYPFCVEGERACPPEDCGGVWGYGDFVEAIRNPEHKEHKSMLEWVGGAFDPENFDPKKATREMKKGLPDWRAMDDGF